jgi:2-polyprenyl-3-methyl-5-hydroxy-6-metoxy-1,4-benzoquinol methylase
MARPATERQDLENATRANGVSELGSLDAQELDNTGERFLPGAHNAAEMSYDHVARYRLVERYVAGKDVIDMGCGAGYGSHSLSRVASSVRGVDLSGEAIAHAKARYEAPNLSYGVGDVTRLPFEDASFEVAISFEVIEHLEEPEDLVREARRVVKEAGLFVVSTPDKRTYSLDRNSVNPYHVREMFPLEFREILERHFEHVEIYGQGALAGSIVVPGAELPADGRVTLESAQFSLEEPDFSQEAPTALYLIAVCANGEPPEGLERPHLILDRDRQIYEECWEWGTTARQIKMYHNHKHREMAARIQETNRKLKEANAQLRRCRNELTLVKRSRSYVLALGVSALARGARRAATGARSLLKKG